MTERFLSDIVLNMREFQKEHFIKQQCVTNAQYLYDCFKENSSSNIKVKAVIVTSVEEKKSWFKCIGGHLIILLDDNETIIDPSYDVFSLKNKSYFRNVKHLMESIDDESKPLFKTSIADFLYFTKVAERINNGEGLTCDEDFYNNQADYVQTKINEKEEANRPFSQ